jgi:hypothetical protein
MFKWFRKIDEWLGGAKRVEYTFGDVPFACYVGCGCFSGSVDVTVYQLRPNQKIFKEKYLGSHWFWLEEYDYSIENGVREVIARVMEEQKEENNISNAWKEFEKTP